MVASPLWFSVQTRPALTRVVMSSPSRLSSLPDVLLQSIIQQLPCGDLLRFARYNTPFTQRAALNPFAHKNAQLMIIKPLSEAAVFVPSPLLQSMPTILRWHARIGEFHLVSAHLSRIVELSHVCRLCELDSGCHFDGGVA